MNRPDDRLPRSSASLRLHFHNGERLGPGKIELLEHLARERSISGAARAMGYEIEEPEPETAETPSSEDGADEPAPAPKKRKKKKAESYNPILQVHYANFIIQ